MFRALRSWLFVVLQRMEDQLLRAPVPIGFWNDGWPPLTGDQEIDAEILQWYQDPYPEDR